MKSQRRRCWIINSFKEILLKNTGSIVIEASLILPLFLSFLLVLNSFIQITMAQIALQTAVSETSKQIATHMFPIKLLYMKAESELADNRTVSYIQGIINQIIDARSKLTDSEELVERYASYIPQPVITLLELERKHREIIEANGQDLSRQLIDQTFIPLVNKSFSYLVRQFADDQVLNPANLNVIDVQLPDLSSQEVQFIGIEAQYSYKLKLPFFQRTLALRKRSVERIWIGS